MKGMVVEECAHPAAAEVEVMSDGYGGAGEVVCGACGVVKFDGAREMRTGGAAEPGTASGAGAGAPAHAQHHQQQAGSRPNLYLEMEVGGKPDRTLRGDKYVHRQTDLAVVSNIAQKLGIPNRVSQAVWGWYCRLRKELRMTKSKCLVLSFYGVCRSMGCPLTEPKMLECIRMELGVRNAHPYLRVIMDASSYMCEGADGGREMVLRKCGFLDMVGAAGRGDGPVGGRDSPDAGADAGGAADVADTMRFALGCEVQALAGKYEAEILSRITGVAKNILPRLCTREQNTRRAARIAVRMARRKVCGHAGVQR